MRSDRVYKARICVCLSGRSRRYSQQPVEALRSLAYVDVRYSMGDDLFVSMAVRNKVGLEGYPINVRRSRSGSNLVRRIWRV